MEKMSNICPEYRGFEPLSGQIKDYKIGIWYFSAKHATLRRKSKDLSARNQNNVSEWSWNIAKLALNNNHTLTLTNIWTILKFLKLDLLYNKYSMQREMNIRETRKVNHEWTETKAVLDTQHTVMCCICRDV